MELSKGIALKTRIFKQVAELQVEPDLGKRTNFPQKKVPLLAGLFLNFE